MNNLETETKQWLGMPLNLLWGYIAIALFMTGDGFELAFLSKYITDLGFSEAQSSFVFSIYGLAAALSAWVSGVFAEIITPRKAMILGFLMWCVFHTLFLIFGLGHKSYPLILLFYGIRGFAYPLFLYSFIVMIVQNVKSTQISPSMGWFWTTYSIGIGVFGSYIPSLTIPAIGEMSTLWLALAFCIAGGLIALLMLRNVNSDSHMHDLPMKEKFSELSRAITLLITNRNILFSSWVRIINTLSLFGFAVIMPLMFTRELGFTTSQWLQIWTVFFATTLVSNVFWGIVGEKLGWMKVVRWFGCIGMALSTLSFYYFPQYYHSVAAASSNGAGTAEFMMAWIPAILLGWFVAAFVPMTAVFTTLEPKHQGAAISVYNLSAGLSNFLAPAIASILLPSFSFIGVVYAYTALYIFAFFITYFIKVKQPGFDTEKA
ncbi:MAG: MFS transporter [Neisseria sp.]|uniref:MFS transporter n=1 Tax=Neisseria sp. TaxID=192066 RepID=UPI0026DB6B13|nr:MFS transporter [Neisseria sp.]MDO4641243.1 MFS transporter [Neisseria sp.]